MSLYILIRIIFFLILAVISILIRLSRNPVSYGFNDMWKTARNDRTITGRDKKINRLRALKQAEKFLTPYKEIFGEHSLVNENCKISLIIENDDKKIICVNKKIVNGKKKLFTAKTDLEFKNYYTQPYNYVIDHLWDTLCMNFDDHTVYENVLSAVRAALLNVQESELNIAGSENKIIQKSYDEKNNITVRTNQLLNINMATESEILALPGINIVMAKKIIRYREKNNGFNSVDEFIEQFKIKDTFANQLRSKICVIKNDEDASAFETNSTDETDSQVQDFHTDNERIIDL